MADKREAGFPEVEGKLLHLHLTSSGLLRSLFGSKTRNLALLVVRVDVNKVGPVTAVQPREKTPPHNN